MQVLAGLLPGNTVVFQTTMDLIFNLNQLLGQAKFLGKELGKWHSVGMNRL